MKTCRCFLQGGLTLLELTVVLLVLTALAGLAIPYVGGVSRSAACQATDATMHAVKEAIMGGPAGAGYYADMLGFYPKATKSTTTADYNLAFLFKAPTDSSWGSMVEFKVKTSVGWHGPYLQSGGTNLSATAGLDASFGSSGVFHPTTNATGKVHVVIDDTAGTQVMDGWHRPIVLQVPYFDDDGSGPHSAAYHPEYARLVSAGPGSGLEPNAAALDTKISDRDATDRDDDRVLYLKYPDPKPGGNQPCQD
ncbi:MAG: hypothetical protein Kow0065_14380 [Methylomicrobium sp.]